MMYKKAFKSEKGKAEVIDVYDKILKISKTGYETLTINSRYGKTFIIRDSSK